VSLYLNSLPCSRDLAAGYVDMWLARVHLRASAEQLLETAELFNHDVTVLTDWIVSAAPRIGGAIAIETGWYRWCWQIEQREQKRRAKP